MATLAKAQVVLMREKAPGGRLIVAEITKDSMTITKAGEL